MARAIHYIEYFKNETLGVQTQHASNRAELQRHLAYCIQFGYDVVRIVQDGKEVTAPS